MLFRLAFSFAIAATCINAASVNRLENRADCAQYGNYPAYTGSCEPTSELLATLEIVDFSLNVSDCGAKGRNCLAEGYSGCTGYPAFSRCLWD